jgi:hypothetical protein
LKLTKCSAGAMSLAAMAVIACSSSPSAAGELTADYGFPQIKEVWANEGAGPANIDLEVTPKGNAICTFSVHPEGKSQKFDSDTGTPQKASFSVPPKGGITVRAEKGSPKAGAQKTAATDATLCSYSVTESKDLSR